MKVLVCDDQQDRCDEIAGRIREAGLPAPEQLVGEKLTKELESLFKNVEACFKNPKTYKSTGKLRFDEADIVVLDNNLALLQVTGARLTAESIAGYVRAFAAAPYVVSLNKNLDVDFDLRYLVGDDATRADLALNTDHLGNLALWTGKRDHAKGGFIPWYWPSLQDIAARRRNQIAFVRDNLNNSVVGTFGFPPKALDSLSRHAMGALSPIARSAEHPEMDGRTIGEIKFSDVFLFSSRSLPGSKERQQLHSEIDGGSEEVREVISRIVAADIDLWFRRDLVGPQEVLVDVPHLLLRMPFLLGDKAGDLGAWKQAVAATAAPFGMVHELFDRFLAPTQFRNHMWVPSPCFWWPELNDAEELNQLFATSGTRWADVVFCEDTSEFEARGSSTEIVSAEFVAEFEGPWDRRHVKHLQAVKYAPLSRFAI